jgi:hypothetical protein
MRQTILLVLAQTLWAAALSQTLPFDKHLALPIQRTNLPVRWKAPKTSLPKTLWIYRTGPMAFSPLVVSNLLAVSSFSEKDRKDFGGTNQLFYGNTGGNPNLRLSFADGVIEYRTDDLRNYGPTNLTKGVPATNQLFTMLTNFLPRLGISASELARKENSTAPDVAFVVDQTVFSVNHGFITNVPFRGIRFNRSVDGAELKGEGGRGEIDYGEYGQIIEIWLEWRNLERVKLFETATPDTIIKWIKEGKGVYWPHLDGVGNEIGVDWTTARRVTIKKAMACYWGASVSSQRQRKPAPSWVHPYALLWATVETGHGNIDVEIGCPVIDEGEQTD